MSKRPVPAAPRRCPSRARIPSRCTPVRRRNPIQPAFECKAPIPHQTRPTTEEELLYSASVIQRLADVPESHDAHHGLRWPNDARNALCHGESHICFLFPSFRRAYAVYDSSRQKNVDPELLQEAQQNQARFKSALQSGDMKSGCVSRRAVLYMIP